MGFEVKYFSYFIFALRHCVIILIFWLRFCPSEINCRHHPFLLTSLIMHERQTASTPSFTGLPPHVSILAQIESLNVALEEAKDSIIGGVKADLDGRGLGSHVTKLFC